MIILGIASVGGDCGMALLGQEGLIGCRRLIHGRTLSDTLLPAISTLLEEIDGGASSLSAVAVAAGPGSFTGIRVGLSAAKGLAYSLAIPLATVSSLEAIAWCAGPRNVPVCPVMAAGKDLVYIGRYRWNGERLKQDEPDRLADLAELNISIEGPLLLLGDAAPLAAMSIVCPGETEVITAPWESGTPLPVAVAMLGAAKVAEGMAPAAEAALPVYLRRAEAEVRLKENDGFPPGASCSG